MTNIKVTFHFGPFNKPWRKLGLLQQIQLNTVFFQDSNLPIYFYCPWKEREG